MASKNNIVAASEQAELLLNGYISTTEIVDEELNGSTRKTDFKDLVDVAQSHYFTITIDKVPVNYNSGLGNKDKFLPVQNMSISYVGFDSMTMPVGIYGDLPLLKRKSVCKISVSLYDNDEDQIEAKLREWESSCFPSDMYVNYLSNIVGKLTYKSYSVKGKLNKTITVSVIPADTITVSRGYEDNAPKMINLNLIAVGPASVS